MNKLVMSLLISVLTVGSVCSVNAQADIEGDWAITKGVYSGQDVPAPVLKSMGLNVAQGQFTAKSGGTTSKGSISVVPGSDKTNQATFSISEGGDAGREIKAIYKFDKHLLKIAFSQNSEYPTDFDSNQTNQYLVLTYLSKSGSRQISAGKGRGKVFGLPAPSLKGN